MGVFGIDCQFARNLSTISFSALQRDAAYFISFDGQVTSQNFVTKINGEGLGVCAFSRNTITNVSCYFDNVGFAFVDFSSQLSGTCGIFRGCIIPAEVAAAGGGTAGSGCAGCGGVGCAALDVVAVGSRAGYAGSGGNHCANGVDGVVVAGDIGLSDLAFASHLHAVGLGVDGGDRAVFSNVHSGALRIFVHVHCCNSGLARQLQTGIFVVHVHGGDGGIGSGEHCVGCVQRDNVILAGQRCRSTDDHYVHSGGSGVVEADIAGGLVDDNAADLCCAFQLHGVHTAAAHDQAAVHGHVLQGNIAFSGAVANDQIAGNGDVLQCAGLVQDGITGDFAFRCAGGQIILQQVIHDLGELGTGDVACGIEHVVGAGNIAGLHHGSHGVLGPISDFRAVGVAVQHALVGAGQCEQAGQDGESFLPGDGHVGVQLVAVALKSAHLHGGGHGIIVPVAGVYIAERGEAGAAVCAEGTGDDSGHLCASQVLTRCDFPVDAVEQSIIDGVLQRLSGPIVGHVREGGGVICSEGCHRNESCDHCNRQNQ